MFILKSTLEREKNKEEESFLFEENHDIVNFYLIFIFQRKS